MTTATATSPFRRLSPPMLLAILLVATVLVTLLAPEPTEPGSHGASSRSTSGDGTRMFLELAQRMGWRATDRIVPFDSVGTTVEDPRSVQVVLDPEPPLRRAEVHALLDHVRAGGGLILDAEGNPEIVDSLGLTMTPDRHLSAVVDRTDEGCTERQTPRDQRAFLIPPTGRDFRWRRPPPGEVTVIGAVRDRRGASSLGIGFPLGAGRIVVFGASDVVVNDALRRCSWRSDVAAARALEYVRPATANAPLLVFDEFHHGYGVRQGSPSAITVYLSRTTSGRFLAQVLLAAFILLLANVARPMLPHDPLQIPRRSPLEHADALANAYVDVAATRTGVRQLVSGLRRRAGRTVPVPASADDQTFLAAVVERKPALAAQVAAISQGLAATVSPREFLAVGEAIREIERQLMNTPARKS